MAVGWSKFWELVKFAWRRLLGHPSIVTSFLPSDLEDSLLIYGVCVPGPVRDSSAACPSWKIPPQVATMCERGELWIGHLGEVRIPRRIINLSRFGIGFEGSGGEKSLSCYRKVVTVLGPDVVAPRDNPSAGPGLAEQGRGRKTSVSGWHSTASGCGLYRDLR